MKTATDAISIIQELPLDERQKVKDYLLTEDEFRDEDYSPDDTEKNSASGVRPRLRNQYGKIPFHERSQKIIRINR